MNALGPRVRDWQDPEKRLALARLASRLGFKDFARVLRAYHRAYAAEEISSCKVSWYGILFSILDETAGERSLLDDPTGYGSMVVFTEADLPKWRQAAWAICPEGSADIERSGPTENVLRDELAYAAKIEDPEIRAMRESHVKAIAASQMAFDELYEYVEGLRKKLFVCPCCQSSVTLERT